MLMIFLLSAQPASNLPDFDRLDDIVKKTGHVIGYAVLAFAYWRALGFREKYRWFAWLLAIIYGLTDELHQSFVPGRQASIWDALIFDNLGALISLWLGKRYVPQLRRDPGYPIVEDLSD